MTNALKGTLAAFLSQAINLAVLFGWDISSLQIASLNGFIDSGLLVWLALTYQNSPKRVPDITGTIKVVDGKVT